MARPAVSTSVVRWPAAISPRRLTSSHMTEPCRQFLKELRISLPQCRPRLTFPTLVSRDGDVGNAQFKAHLSLSNPCRHPNRLANRWNREGEKPASARGQKIVDAHA